MAMATTWASAAFSLREHSYKGYLVAQTAQRYKCFCILLRLVSCLAYAYAFIDYILKLTSEQMILLCYLRLISTEISTLFILLLQLKYEQQLLAILNRLLRIFWRLAALTGARGFGGSFELLLLCCKLLSLLHECVYMWHYLFADFSAYKLGSLLCDIYCSVGAGMICNICFICYLSFAVLYKQLVAYLRHDLRLQLQQLQQQGNRQQLLAVEYRLSECISLYNEIQCLSKSFQRIFDLPLCHVLLFGFISMTFVAYYTLFTELNKLSACLLMGKMFLDILLLTWAVQQAVSSSIVSRLGLEHYYVSGSSGWHSKWDLFLMRLQLCELRVRPLGLFEINNQLILLYLSGLVTYFTYIMQYALQIKQL